MFKHRIIAEILIFALTIGFAAQIFAVNYTAKQNATGIVYGANGPLAGAMIIADGDNGSGFATTDASGHYSMTTGLGAGSYNITAFAYGYLTMKRSSVNVMTGQTTPGIDFDLQTSGGISGTVSDAVNSSGIGNAFIFANLANGTGDFGFYANTAQDGKYLMATNLPTGLYNVSIFSAPDGYISHMTTANVVAGVETKNVNLQLPRSGIISGKVAAPNGTGLFGIDVTAFSSGGGFNFGSAKTDVSGNYKIGTGLGTGNYTVMASGAGNFTQYGGLLNPTPVMVTAGQETSNINMELTPVSTPPTPSGTITGRITDQSNNPIRSASVSATGSNGNGFGETDINGNYNITSGLGTGNDYNVSVTDSGYYDASYPTLVSVTVGQTTPNINIQMTAKPAQNFGTITGTVTGAPNPIIPEYPYIIMQVLSLSLVAAAAGKLLLRTKRHNKKENSV